MQSNKTAEFFDSYAHGFDALYGNKNTLTNKMINKLFRKCMRLRFEKTMVGCNPIEGKSVLDIGCGPGHFGINLALKGAGEVTGIDFATTMISLANNYAAKAGVADKCKFIQADFNDFNPECQFDYIILMGFMDYVDNPKDIIEKVLAMNKSKAFFSFPTDGGILAFQRKLRYKKRCPLYMYTRQQLEDLFVDIQDRNVTIKKIGRDFFVTVSKK